MASDNFYIKQMEIGPMENYVYFVGDKKKREIAVIDPGWESETILKAAEEEGMKITHILATHTHFDHVNALEEVLKATDAKVAVHAQEAPFLPFIQENLLSVKGSDKVKVGDVEIEFLHTPGHTPGSQCFLTEGRLVSGDTLFIKYCGRTDLPGGSNEELFNSLHDVLAKLPKETIVYPGHNYTPEKSSSIQTQLKENPYLAAQSLNEFIQAHQKMV